MAHFHDNALVGASGQGGYQISRSLRFNSADSAYLNRTPGAGGGITKGAISAWIKRSALGTTQSIIQARQDTNNQQYIGFTTNDTIEVGITAAGTTTLSKVTSAVYRDCSAWYHIFFYQDNTLATAEDRYQLYVNGVRVTAWGTNTNTAPQNTSTFLGTSNPHYIGAYNAIGGYYNGYITEFHFIYQPTTVPTVSAFGETDTITGVWKPKKYAGTYGTNGFYLNFSDNSGTTSTTLGKDYSGNGNNWTPNNFLATELYGRLYRQATGTATTAFSSANLVGNFPATSSTSNYIYDAELAVSTTTATFGYANAWGGVEVLVSADGTNWTSKGIQTNAYTTVTNSTAFKYVRWFIASSFYHGITNNPANIDSLIDTPTPYADGGNGRGNYATLNPLSTAATLADGNLDANTSGSIYAVPATILFPDTGKYYAEFTVGTGSSPYPQMGILDMSANFRSNANIATVGKGVIYSADGTLYKDGALQATYSTFTTGDLISVAYDPATRNVWVAKNGTWQNSGNPAAGTGAVATASTATQGYAFACGAYSLAKLYANFGQRPFAYTPPSGFVALNTQNLPEPSIKKPSSYFDVKTWTATGTDPLVVSGLGFSPDLVWAKARNDSYNHVLVDSVRGVNNVLSSNLTNAEASYTTVTQFNSDGFNASGTTNNNYSLNCTATVARTYVGWCWDESATPGFDIVTYTGTGATTRNISHSLGVAPSFVIVKSRSSGSDNWNCWHTSLNNTAARLLLNSTAAVDTGSPSIWGTGGINPTSTTFQVGDNTGTNANTYTYVAYLWSEVANFSKFGSYTGNSSADGTFVFCGFRPAYVLLKSTTGPTNWWCFDAKRNTYNQVDLGLVPSQTNADTSGYPLDFLSNGFKLRNSNGDFNQSGRTYIFAAFAEAPFKYALAR